MANNYNHATITPDLPVSAFTEADLELLALCGIETEQHGDEVYLFATDSFHEETEADNGERVNCVAMLQQKLKTLDGESYPSITIEGASTCSKMRTGEFGGFAYFITREAVRYISTWAWLHEMETTRQNGVAA